MIQPLLSIDNYCGALSTSNQLSSNGKPVFAHNIVYIQALSNYSKIFLNNGKQIVITKTLKKVAEILDHHSFLRIHNSIIININFIDRHKIIDYQKVYLQNGICFTISRRKKIACKKSLSNNLKIAS